MKATIVDWAQWQGEIVDGEFHLDRYLGGGEQSGVFQTEFRGQRAAIKISTEDPRHEWGAELSHPNLVRIFRTGRWQVDEHPLHYVVMELADEVLSQVISDRPLTAEEAREMLTPVLDAVAYLHGRGLVHGRLKPGNIMSAGEQLKISSDGLCQAGEASGLKARGAYDPPETGEAPVSSAADVWGLGMTLVEVLTQRRPESNEAGDVVLPAALPEPFAEIAKGCLQRDPRQRWTVEQISARLSPPAAAAPVALPPPPERVEAPEPSQRRYAGVAIAVGVAVIALVAGSRMFRSNPAPSPAPAAAVREAARSAPPPAAPPVTSSRIPGKVAKQVSPQVSTKARDTLQGELKVVVRVRVNSSGVVTSAKLESPRVSRYFDRVALQAARRWRFTPPKVDGHAISSAWLLDFNFSRSGTAMHANALP